MTAPRISDIVAKRVEVLPDCVYRQIGGIRIYRTPTKDILECLYEDGWGNPFWGPVPVVEEPKP